MKVNAMKSLSAFLIIKILYTIAAPPPQIITSNNEITPAANVSADVSYILDRTFMPDEYTIHLKTYLDESYEESVRFIFNGSCSMMFKYIGYEIFPKNFTIHAKNLHNLKFDLFEIRSGKGIKIDIVVSDPHPLSDKVEIEVKGGLKGHTPYVLNSTYVGLMDDDMLGFYKSQYEDDKGNTRWLAATQFETTHARRAFPCFDEPFFKAVFKISISRHKKYNVAANTRLVSSVKDPQDENRYIDTFEKSLKMSTYIVGFLVSEFLTRSDGNFLIHARPEFYSQTLCAGEISPKLLNFMNSYTAIDYRTVDDGDHKMAMAAIPDFSAGAMENWGLLTYRERSLLYDEKESSILNKQSIAGVIAHEQAHMWFGDLVTCDWWSYTWLNEAFASHWQYFTTHAVFPEYEMDKQFPIYQTQSVFTMDSLPGVTPMTDPTVASPEDLQRMFNSISYKKGGAVLRKIKHAMGEKNFQNALQEYLKKYYLSTATPNLLFEIFDKYWPSDDKAKVGNTTEFYKSWTEQVGYPVITVTLSNDRESVNVKQKRFLLYDKLVDTTSDRNLTYVVPFTYTTSAEKDFENTSTRIYLPKSAEQLTFKLPKQSDWIIANIQQIGYYRVLYDMRTTHALHHALSANDHSGIVENNRAQFVDDLLAFARAGLYEYNETLKILEYIENDESYTPWTSALNGLSFVAIRLGAENTDEKHFTNYIQSITDTIYKKLGFEEKSNERILNIYNRDNILYWACKYQNQDCIKRAKDLFAELRKNGKAINPNIRRAVYCTSMREGDEDDFKFLFSKWKNETVSTEQSLLVSVMGCVKTDHLVTQYYNIILKDIRRQDKSSAISSLYSENDSSVDKVYKLITESYEKFDEAFGKKGASASTLSGIAARFTSEEQKKQLVDFKNRSEVKTYYGDSIKILDNAVKTVDENLDWSNKRLGSARQYLRARSSGSFISISFLLVVFSVL